MIQMTLVYLLSVLLIGPIACGRSGSNDLWQIWKNVHGKQYADLDSETARQTIWQDALDRIHEHNLRYDLGMETYRMGLNQFTDLTWQEFQQMYSGVLYKPNTSEADHRDPVSRPINISDIPNLWDWRQHDRVTSVKNQQNCGACYSFSAAGAMEGQMQTANVPMTDLSVQQIIDCSRPFGNCGCSGGYMKNAYNYASEYGIQTWTDYPYFAGEGPCKYNQSAVVFKINSFRQVKPDDENDLLDAVYNVGPSSVGIHTIPEFMYYTSGVFQSKDCIPEQLNHAVVVVGFGEEGSSKYWLIKNSWSSSWGEDGYMKLARDMNNMCGIATLASVPLVN